MNDIEHRIADSLRARASQVTEESLSAETAPVRAPRRWPALVAAAAVVGIVGIVGVTSLVANRADTVAPAESTSPVPHTSVSEPPTTSQAPSSVPSGPTSPSAGTTIVEQPPLKCGGTTCTVLQTVMIGGETLELLASPSTTHAGSWTNWAVRVRGGTVVAGAQRTDNFVGKTALRCQTVAGRSVCLVHTSYLGDSDTNQGMIKDRSGWRFTGATFATPYGALRVDVRDLDTDGTLEVVALEQPPNIDKGTQWTARVWKWNGTPLGCTPPVPTREELPGWPTVTPEPSTLNPSNCFYQQ